MLILIDFLPPLGLDFVIDTFLFLFFTLSFSTVL